MWRTAGNGTPSHAPQPSARPARSMEDLGPPPLPRLSGPGAVSERPSVVEPFPASTSYSYNASGTQLAEYSSTSMALSNGGTVVASLAWNGDQYTQSSLPTEPVVSPAMHVDQYSQQGMSLVPSAAWNAERITPHVHNNPEHPQVPTSWFSQEADRREQFSERSFPSAAPRRHLGGDWEDSYRPPPQHMEEPRVRPVGWNTASTTPRAGFDFEVSATGPLTSARGHREIPTFRQDSGRSQCSSFRRSGSVPPVPSRQYDHRPLAIDSSPNLALALASPSAVMSQSTVWPPPPLPPISQELSARLDLLESQSTGAHLEVMFERRVEQLENELAAARASVAQVGTLEAQLVAKDAEWRDRLRSTEAQLDSMEELRRSCRAAEEERDRLNLEIQRLHSQDSEALMRARDAEEERERLRLEVHRLQSSYNAELSSTSDLRRKAGYIEEEKDQMRSEMAQMQAVHEGHLNRQSMIMEEKERLRADMQRIQAAYDAEQASRLEVTRKHQMVETDLVRVQRELEFVKNSYDDRQHQHGQIESEVTHAKMEVQRLQQALATEQSGREDAVRKHRQSEVDMERMREELVHMQSQRGHEYGDFERLRADFDLERRQLMSQVERLTSDIAHYKNIVAERDQAFKNMDLSLESARDEIELLKAEVMKAKSELAAVISERDALKVRTELQQDTQRLRKSNANLHDVEEKTAMVMRSSMENPHPPRYSRSERHTMEDRVLTHSGNRRSQLESKNASTEWMADNSYNNLGFQSENHGKILVNLTD